MLELAKEQAEVGDDIRWDVVMGMAATMPCGLKQPSAPRKKRDDDECSTAMSTTASSGAAESEDTYTATTSGSETEMSRTYGKKPHQRGSSPAVHPFGAMLGLMQ